MGNNKLMTGNSNSLMHNKNYSNQRTWGERVKNSGRWAAWFSGYILFYSVEIFAYWIVGNRNRKVWDMTWTLSTLFRSLLLTRFWYFRTIDYDLVINFCKIVSSTTGATSVVACCCMPSRETLERWPESEIERGGWIEWLDCSIFPPTPSRYYFKVSSYQFPPIFNVHFET
jgi:hypothetical protein